MSEERAKAGESRTCSTLCPDGADAARVGDITELAGEVGQGCVH